MWNFEARKIQWKVNLTVNDLEGTYAKSEGITVEFTNIPLL